MPVQKKAKLDVLQALRKVAMELIKEKADEGLSDGAPEAMQKVAVMAKDKEGLKQGLEKAEDILGGEEGESEDEEIAEEEALHLDPSKSEEEVLAHEAMESPEEQADEEAMLLKKLQELRNKKKMLKV